MTVLRSREILPTKPTPKTLKNQAKSIEPATPAQTVEPGPTRRRSLRIASISNSGNSPIDGLPQKRKNVESEEIRVLEEKEEEEILGSVNGEKGVLSLRSGKRVIKRRMEIEGEKMLGDGNGEVVPEILEKKLSVEENGSVKSRRKRCGVGSDILERNKSGNGEVVLEISEKQLSVDENGSVKSGRKRRGGGGIVIGNVEVVLEILEKQLSVDENGSVKSGMKRRGGGGIVIGNERKGQGEDTKGKRVLSDLSEEGVGSEMLERNKSGKESGGTKERKRYSREEKGKRILDSVDLLVSGNETVDPGLECPVKNSVDNNVGPQEGTRNRRSERRVNESRTKQFRDIARQNAPRFAHFDPEEGEENHLALEDEMELPSREEEVNREIEDWPGPFSTAMKIIRDRADKLNLQQGNLSSKKRNSVPIMWIPKGRDRSKPLVPSLQELCLTILAKNADAITSLENVPDALRHKLSRMLCDSRRMDSHFFDLLVRGLPTEIYVRDCSWLTEEEFSKSFEGCDTNTLTVLQLDLCGRCMPDYILPATLARAPNCLPALTTLSMSGACRLSDDGLRKLVSSAPALRSINLSQCSLLTTASIDTLAESLGSVLRELYLNDCQSIDPMLILPALKKLEHLEVLSLAGIQTVCDDFVREFIVARGHNMKELVLTDCLKLTDSSLKLIAETCSGLCALDLSNLCKLTDLAIGYLANGCQTIHALKLCRNAFSDEAIAAYLETSGESLKELSLNNVKKVAHNTAFSLARCSRKLLSLDLSWCRNLTNEAVGLIVDSCSSLRMLKLFGCTQITNVFLDGHSNPEVQIIGLKMSAVMEHVEVPDPQQGPLKYSSAFSSM